MAGTGVPGVEDVAGLAHWLRAQELPGVHGLPERLPAVTMISGGRSNLTYRLDLGDGRGSNGQGGDGQGGDGQGGPGAGRRLVLRRPPLGHVLPTAHDMGREYRVLTALADTAVPVPRPLAFCEDQSVIGSPFYLMEWVDGAVLRSRDDAAAITPAQAGRLSERFIDMLATIHGIDVPAVGLAGFGRPEGYLARQLARWQRQWDLSATREMPGYAELVARLDAGLPTAGGASPPDTGEEAAGQTGALVHGDFRIDNMLVRLAAEPAIAAVVDWEMSTLGDPLADLGLTLVYWTNPGEQDPLELTRDGGLTATPGFWTRDQLAGRYAQATGRDLSKLGYYMAFGCFKLAVVLEGIHARFLQHKTVGEGFERQGEGVPILIARAHRLLDGDS
jgi:aminoglycoside phosphotransferase (APT) family kinase protein